MVGRILTDVMTKDTLMSRKIGFGKGQDFYAIWQQLQVKVTCIMVLSHIGHILSRVGHVSYTFCVENHTDG